MTFVVPNPDRVWGIDISGRWDGNVDFTATKRAGATFAIIKCIDGTVPTRLWKENRIRAFMAGLLVGEYGWLYRDANVPCREQARATWELIKNEPKQIPVAIDFEWTRYMGAAANPDYSDLDKWVTEFTRLSGYKPGFYSAAGYMNDYGVMPPNLRSKFAYFWVANYGVIRPTLPIGFTEWDFWQFAATGDASVVAPNDTGKLETDLNYWNGSLQTLKDLAGYSEPPTQPPVIGEPTVAKNKVTILYPDGARERQYPHAAGTLRNLLAANTVHYSDFDEVPDMDDSTNPGKRWIKLQSGWYIATVYPASNGITQRARVEPVAVEPAPDEITVTVDAEITATLNGVTYRGVALIENLRLTQA